MPPSALRDRKRERTRRALLEAAVEQFESRGYEATTVADIAAAAEVGTRTFFNYFASKEELLFPEPDERVTAAVQAIATRRPDERPVEVLLRALRAAGDNPGDHLGDNLAARIAVLRAQISRTVPAVSGRAAYAQLASQQEIARQLRAAFPEELDEVGAAALVGAVIGAVTGALTALFQNRQAVEDGDRLHRQIRETTSKVLAPWLNPPCTHSHRQSVEDTQAPAQSTRAELPTSEPTDAAALQTARAVLTQTDTAAVQAAHAAARTEASVAPRTEAPEAITTLADRIETQLAAPEAASVAKSGPERFDTPVPERMVTFGAERADTPAADQPNPSVPHMRPTVLEQPSWRARVHPGSPVMLTDRRMGIAPELRRSVEPPAPPAPEGESDLESDSRAIAEAVRRASTEVLV
ncbi:helix-turn-helix domain-containing protein [Nocardia sp. NPDC051030]|uniref:TetR/AcrR family transcriptional regulator n=1 Tax=Nocardia sp. NPDC051030 TaxID=3155162 RepID=UPI00343035F3